MRRLLRIVVGTLAAVGFIAVLGAFGFVAQGIAAQRRPSMLENRVAGAARHFLIPAAARASANPVVATPEVLQSARRHFADHCASCHGNDGKGRTTIGRNLFPPAPDMTSSATQSLSDGELFWIIENGVRNTGMPGWRTGDAEGERESWECVRWIRSLPQQSDADLEEMKRFNPLSREECRDELEIEKFLAGSSAPEAPESHHH